MKIYRIIAQRFIMEVAAENQYEAEKIFRESTHNRRGEDIVEVVETDEELPDHLI